MGRRELLVILGLAIVILARPGASRKGWGWRQRVVIAALVVLLILMIGVLMIERIEAG